MEIRAKILGFSRCTDISELTRDPLLWWFLRVWGNFRSGSSRLVRPETPVNFDGTRRTKGIYLWAGTLRLKTEWERALDQAQLISWGTNVDCPIVEISAKEGLQILWWFCTLEKGALGPEPPVALLWLRCLPVRLRVLDCWSFGWPKLRLPGAKCQPVRTIWCSASVPSTSWRRDCWLPVLPSWKKYPWVPEDSRGRRLEWPNCEPILFLYFWSILLLFYSWLWLWPSSRLRWGRADQDRFAIELPHLCRCCRRSWGLLVFLRGWSWRGKAWELAKWREIYKFLGVVRQGFPVLVVVPVGLFDLLGADGAEKHAF